MIGHILLVFAFWTQWAVLGANVVLLWRNRRNLKDAREQVAWMDEQIKAAERENEVLGNIVALYLAFHFRGLYW